MAVRRNLTVAAVVRAISQAGGLSGGEGSGCSIALLPLSGSQAGSRAWEVARRRPSCFFLFGTVCLVLGAMGVMGPA
ncbi:hypothetical protein DC008_18880 [Streptomyces nigra]|nr:hypothetical protein DC008_18880 [Streptomyces nigra]